MTAPAIEVRCSDEVRDEIMKLNLLVSDIDRKLIDRSNLAMSIQNLADKIEESIHANADVVRLFCEEHRKAVPIRLVLVLFALVFGLVFGIEGFRHLIKAGVLF